MASVEDYNFEGADAGASLEIPMEAGQIKKGGYMNIKVSGEHHRRKLFRRQTFSL